MVAGQCQVADARNLSAGRKRWCMPWYYPNFQNDMWRIFGIIYFDDKFHFVDVEHKTYRLDAIKEFLMQKGWLSMILPSR